MILFWDNDGFKMQNITVPTRFIATVKYAFAIAAHRASIGHIGSLQNIQESEIRTLNTSNWKVYIFRKQQY